MTTDTQASRSITITTGMMTNNQNGMNIEAAPNGCGLFSFTLGKTWRTTPGQPISEQATNFTEN